MPLSPPGLCQVRLVRAREPLRIRPETRVDRSSPRHSASMSGAIGGDAGCHLGTFGDRAVSGNKDIGALAASSSRSSAASYAPT